MEGECIVINGSAWVNPGRERFRMKFSLRKVFRGINTIQFFFYISLTIFLGSNIYSRSNIEFFKIN